MPLLLSCPICKNQCRVPDETQGKHVNCPSCSKTFAVPAKPDETKAGEAKEKPKEVTAKEIEIFGNELVDKQCEMVCTFNKVTNDWVKMLLKDESFVGMYVHDSKGDFFQYAFVRKEKYGRDLLKMKRGDSLRLIGKVKKVNSTYVFMVEEIVAQAPKGGKAEENRRQGKSLRG